MHSRNIILLILPSSSFMLFNYFFSKKVNTRKYYFFCFEKEDQIITVEIPDKSATFVIGLYFTFNKNVKK